MCGVKTLSLVYSVSCASKVQVADGDLYDNKDTHLLLPVRYTGM